MVAFCNVTGRAAYQVLQQAADDQEAAQNAMGPGTQEMTNQQFDHFAFDPEFEALASLRQPMQTLQA
jgi:hypothetical protein